MERHDSHDKPARSHAEEFARTLRGLARVGKETVAAEEKKYRKERADRLKRLRKARRGRAKK